MPTDSREAHRPAPMSPCISICALGLDGYCSGCLRSGDEIARWLAMTDDEKWQLLAELEERRKRRGRVIA
jgi:uncharacterized protein